MKARVTVTLKSGVLDPQGKAIEGALNRSASRASRACARARCSTSSSPTAMPRAAEATLRDAAEKLLANTVIENFRVEVGDLAARPLALCSHETWLVPPRPLRLSRSRHAADDAPSAAGVRRAPEAWTETKWPFLIDQWGLGNAYQCKAADCGIDVTLYLRAKVGFCNCTTGVAEDDEIDRVGDIGLIGWQCARARFGTPVRSPG